MIQAVILCGGSGTRLSEETTLRPKPMVEIGGVPILLHIMRYYASFGVREFILALGYRGDFIKDFFLNYHARTSDITAHVGRGDVEFENHGAEDWTVHMVDTGLRTMTGGRLKRLEHRLRSSGTFLLTYGDGLSDVDIAALVHFHRHHGRLATVTAVHPPARFGGMALQGEQVSEFKEKPHTARDWINGGYFVFEPQVFDYIDGDETVLEEGPLERLAREGQLMGFRHTRFWQCMDTIRDRNLLEMIWDSGDIPWKRGS